MALDEYPDTGFFLQEVIHLCQETIDMYQIPADVDPSTAFDIQSTIEGLAEQVRNLLSDIKCAAVYSARNAGAILDPESPATPYLELSITVRRYIVSRIEELELLIAEGMCTLP